jgi:organic radical activating enzyme
MKQIFAIESTALCNYSCEYCVQRYMSRPKGHMEWGVFLRSIELCRRLGQEFVVLSNHGEPLLHPNIVKMVEHTSKHIGGSTFPTNGSLLTKQLAIDLKNAGLTQLVISTHNKDDSDRAIAICDEVGLFRRINDNYTYSWAGQVPHQHVCEVQSGTSGCRFIRIKSVVILWDGTINTCCVEMDGKWSLGSIWDIDVFDIEPISLPICPKCHWR